MKCPRCLNTDAEWFYKGSRGWYCRRCIGFGRAMLAEEAQPVTLSAAAEESSEYMLKYPLTKEQAQIAARCASLAETTDVLLHCVCGAGKTELVVLSIAQMLKKGKKVCFAVPRRQVVLELRDRLAQYFPRAKVIAVCGGFTTVTDGDLILCTTHQLYRYYQAFDLLILDEPDAFPFRGDPVLHGIAASSCKGHTVYLTATPDEELKKRVEENTMVELVLNRRPHGHPLPVPRIIIAPSFCFIFFLLKWLADHKKHPRIIFVPSLRTAHLLHSFLNLLMNCMIVTSQKHDKDEIIAAVRVVKGMQGVVGVHPETVGGDKDGARSAQGEDRKSVV